MGGETPYLPEEIITEILKRLPVKPLIRFQCVCKRWKNLIKSPPFIADHLHHSTHQNASLLLKQNGRSEPSEPLRLLYIDCKMHVHRVQNPPLIGSSSKARIISSSNGLVCLLIKKDISNYSCRLHNSLIFLWNPATREVRQIPTTKTSVDPERDSIGFGFNSVVDDYQIVKTYNDGEVTKGVEVYSLRTGSWKGIESETLKGIVHSIKGDTITVNGSIFWDCFKQKKEEGKQVTYLMVSFDMAKEVITLIPRPRQSMVSELTVYEDKVAICCLHRIDHSTKCYYPYSFDLLVLEEGTGLSAYGERWSWTKKFTTDLISPYKHPLTIWRNEIVCYFDKIGRKTQKDEENFSLYVINGITNECNRLWIPEYRFDQVINYVESLVPVGNIHLEEPLS